MAMKVWEAAKIAPFMVAAMVVNKLCGPPDGNEALEQVEQNVWVARGTAPVGCLFNMTVVQSTETGKLVVFSALAPLPATVAEVRALGDVAAIIIPSALHMSFGADWAALFPDATLAAPALAIDDIVAKGCEVEFVSAAVLAEHGITAEQTTVTHANEEIYSFDVVRLEDGATVTGMLLGNDLVNHSGPDDFVLCDACGFEGLGRARLYSIIGIADHAEWARVIVEALGDTDGDSPDIHTILFGHGRPMRGPGASAAVAAAVSSPSGQIRAMYPSTMLMYFVTSVAAAAAFYLFTSWAWSFVA